MITGPMMISWKQLGQPICREPLRRADTMGAPTLEPGSVTEPPPKLAPRR